MKSINIKSSILMRNVMLGGSFFVVLICSLLLITGYRIYNESLLQRYTADLDNVLSYCGREGEEAFGDLPGNLALTRIERLYTIKGEGDESRAELIYAKYPLEAELFLSDRMKGNRRSPEFRARYEKALQTGEIMYYVVEEGNDWTYTGFRSVPSSDGGPLVVGADVSLIGARNELVRYMIAMLAISIIMLAAFVLLVGAWLRHRLIYPLMQVGRSVVEYAEASREHDAPDILVYRKPDIHTGDEIEILADAIVSLSEDMNDYVERLLLSRSEMRIMKRHVNRMDEMAYRDALTGANNKAAYERIKGRLDLDIMNNRARFAIVMVDLNNLKVINDRFGHEAGDDYIKGACDIIRGVYENSPVFRVGGDEFVVVLENKDYNNREGLLEQFETEIEKVMKDTTRPERERISAAAGMASYNQSSDEDSDSVFRRADNLMYEEKKKMKSLREEKDADKKDHSQ